MSTTRIKCGNCKGSHTSTAEVRACYYPPITKLCMKLEDHAPHTDLKRNWHCPGKATPAAVEQKSATARQLDYISRLGGDVNRAKNYTVAGASNYIDRLKKGRKPVNTAAPISKVPLNMLEKVPDGFYASRLDTTHAHVFFRISRPKSGNYKGALKVQTQHGPEYKLALVVSASGVPRIYNSAVEDELLLVTVDTSGCAIEYFNKIGRCMRCNTELTDERSRWYGIGPECEKHWPHIIEEQNFRKGEFVPGQDGE